MSCAGVTVELQPYDGAVLERLRLSHPVRSAAPPRLAPQSESEFRCRAWWWWTTRTRGVCTPTRRRVRGARARHHASPLAHLALFCAAVCPPPSAVRHGHHRRRPRQAGTSQKGWRVDTCALTPVSRDRSMQLAETEAAGAYAVIAPQMGKQLVAFQARMPWKRAPRLGLTILCWAGSL